MHDSRLQPERIAMAVEKTEVKFYSEGHELKGYLFRPVEDGSVVADPRGAWITLGGFASTMGYRGMVEDVCLRVAAAGYVALAFDLRGFGISADGDRLVHPAMQVADTRNAITYLQTIPFVD